jgi:flavin-dependent dehydrogenase
MYDAIIIGARCAGSPTAMLLARKGYKVLLVDRATFPSDIMSTHVVKSPGGAKLQDWGLLDKVLAAANCPPIPKITLDFGAFSLTGSAPPADGVSVDYSPRRIQLDKVLVDAAVDAGVELRESFTVEEILTDGERIDGIRGSARGGGSVTEQARIVVGADGQHSILARKVHAPTYNEKPALACYYYTYWSGVPLDGAMICPRDGRVVLAFPTNNNAACILVGWRNNEFHEYRSDIEGNYLKTLDLVPGLAEKVRAGRREERFRGTADLPNFFRKPYGSGWALVGDAGLHKDPITAQGITDAFRDAELLAEAIDAGFSGSQSLDEALGEYERKRNEAAMPIYELTCLLAALEPPPPEMAQLFFALQGNQAQTDRLIGAIVGTVAVQEFFSPDNVRQIVARV